MGEGATVEEPAHPVQRACQIGVYSIKCSHELAHDSGLNNEVANFAHGIQAMISTVDWAESLNISVEEGMLAEEAGDYCLGHGVRDIAIRAVILQGVVAVAYQVDPEPVIEWFHEQEIWDAVTPKEKEFLLLPTRSTEECNRYRAHQEAEWTLLWVIGKIAGLGLPTHYCDTRRLVDEIIPPPWNRHRTFRSLCCVAETWGSTCRG